ncbi:MAG TPA: DegT/DnrJ/EryC1/StrS aminotransferase family protein [Candidatus Saccharimonadales bacterium]|nr:DegT/DnrJ/EryC1/StrS aminotransferase family protein [Candidatus Saccharimonadales bacterium]
MIKLIKSGFYNEAETKKALADFILNTEMLSMNVQCKTFEESFAKKQGRKYAVYVSNGSVANLLLIQSMLNLGHFKKGDKIGFSALTWPTNPMPLIQLGLVPVAIDCNLETLNVSPENLKQYIGDLRGLFLTNVLGFCDNLPAIKQLCDENDVILLEDNCESLGSKTGGTLLGNFGLASTFSFFVGHHMSTIEGGMVCTDDKDLYEMLVMGRAHGWDRNLAPETQEKLRASSGADEFYAKYTFYDLASNFRPTEINGFIGNQQIGFWDEIVGKRVANFKKFVEAINANDDFYTYKLDHMEIPSNFAMPVICKNPELAAKYKQKFSDAQVEIRPVIAGNMTKQPFYQKYVQDLAPRPNSDLIHANGFYFGNNPEMTDEEIDTLCNLLAKD